MPSQFHSATNVLNSKVFIMFPLDIIQLDVRNDMNRVFCPSHTGTKNCREFALKWSTFGTKWKTPVYNCILPIVKRY